MTIWGEIVFPMKWYSFWQKLFMSSFISFIKRFLEAFDISICWWYHRIAVRTNCQKFLCFHWWRIPSCVLSLRHSIARIRKTSSRQKYHESNGSKNLLNGNLQQKPCHHRLQWLPNGLFCGPCDNLLLKKSTKTAYFGTFLVS